ncbi:MAG TPA: two-component regulator propeller domain-containing protein [Bacteroidales bacterium]|nr:two-component regulator propeller domain-containing protein [Bacteroidales bacterium]
MFKPFLIGGIFFLCLVFNNLLLGQDVPGLNFDRISSENYIVTKGLSQNSAFCITQDMRGYIWVGTWDGLNRYDGYRFLTFKTSITDDPDELSSQTIYSLFTDSRGTLWIGTEKGLNSYDFKTHKFIHYINSSKNPFSISSDTVLCIAESEDNVLWVGTSNGLNKFDRTSGIFYHFRLNPNNANSPSNNNINCILIDKDKNIWLGTNKGLNYFDIKNKIFTHWYSTPGNYNSLLNDVIRDLMIDKHGNLWICSDGGIDIYNPVQKKIINKFFHNDLQKNSLSNNNVRTVLQDNDGAIWVGTYGGGLNRFDEKNKSFVCYKNDIYDNKSLSNDYINKIFQDRSGIIWVATAWKGVSKIDKYSNRFNHIQHLTDNENSLNDNNVWAICQDETEKIWIATDNGINIYDRKSDKYSFIIHNPSNSNSLPSNLVRQIFPDKNGIFWFGTYDAGICSYNPETKYFKTYAHDPKNPYSLSNNRINFIMEDSRGLMWVATDNGLNRFNRENQTFKRYFNKPENKNSLSNNTIYGIYEDKNGVLWLCTLGGLNRFNPVNDSFTVFRKNPKAFNSLSSDRIFSIYEDLQGIFWLATCGGGLNRFNRATGDIKYYLEENGLPNNVTYNILEDNNNNLWISTNYGLTKFNKNNETFVSYDAKDGIQSNEFNLNAAFHNKKTGEMFFGGMNGFNSFYPENILTNTYIPPLVITGFYIFDKLQSREIMDNDTIQLSYDDNFFSFEFAAIDYSNPPKNRYAYFLNNFDNKWNYCDASRRYASYTRVPPGTYLFKLKGSNSDGLWNEKGISFTIVIRPPWWRTWWFRVGSVLLIAFIAWYIIFLRLRNIRIRNEDEKRILEIEKQMFSLEQTSLRLQMNPHFIFNSLNSIQSVVIAGNTDKAINYLAKFSNLMRFILTHSQKPFVNLSDEIKAMEIYLDVERLRFDNKFNYSFEIDPDIDEEFIEIPPMIIQPYIENAILHGLLNKEGTGTLKIQLKLKDKEYISCIVEDDGIGREKSAEIRQRSGLKHKSKGMAITQKRLEILNKSSKDEANVKITDLKDGQNNSLGTRVEILIIYKEV